MTDRDRRKPTLPLTEGFTDQISTNDVRDNLSDVVNKVGYGKEKIIITRRGKPLAAIIPVELVEAYEEMKKEFQELKKSQKTACDDRILSKTMDSGVK